MKRRWLLSGVDNYLLLFLCVSFLLVPRLCRLPVYADDGASAGAEHVEYEFDFGDRDMLPGWDQEIWPEYEARVWYENSEEERRISVAVTDVQTDDPSVIRIEPRSDENNPDNHWWYLRAQAHGSAQILVSYTTSDGRTGTETVTWHVGNEVYEVNARPEDGSYNVLPGGTVDLTSDAWHKGNDDRGNYYEFGREEMADGSVTWEWSVDEDSLPDDLRGTVAVVQDETDPWKASMLFTDSPDWDEHFGFGVRILVSLWDNGEQKAENSVWLNLHGEYMEVWPAAIDSNMDVGSTLSIVPELRQYSREYPDGYQVITSGTNFRMEVDDSNCAETALQADGSFLLTRKGDWDTNVRLIAEQRNASGSYEEVCRQDYHLNGRNYDFWFDIDGDDGIYSDGSRTFSINVSHLDSLGGDFTLEIAAGTGVWDAAAGAFENPIPEGNGWNYNSDTREITFNGAVLSAAGITRIETKTTAMHGGYVLREQWCGFDVQEPWRDFGETSLREETLFLSDDPVWIGKDAGEGIRLSDSVFPGGDWHPIRILSLTAEAEEDPLDTRDPLSVEEEEDGWRLVPQRGGETVLTAEVEIYDPDSDRSEVIDWIFRKWVGDWRAFVSLRPVKGSYDFCSGTSLTLVPGIFVEQYDWQTGRSEWLQDTSAYQVEYELWTDWIDGRFVEEMYDGDYEAARADAERYWSYVENADGSLTVTAAENAPAMNLRAAARLFEPEEEGGHEIAYTEEQLTCAPDLLLVEMDGTLDSGMPVGASGTLTPHLMQCVQGGEPAEITSMNGAPVRWLFDWYAGSGEDTEDIPHLVITDATGKQLSWADPVGEAPFTIRRVASWGMGFTVKAVTDGQEEDMANASYWFDGQEYGISFEAESGHPHEAYGNYAAFFDGEPIDVRVTIPALAAVPEAYQSLLQRELICHFHDYWGNEIACPAGFAFTAAELNPETGLHLTAERAASMLDALYADHPDLPDQAGFYLELEAAVTCDGQELARDWMELDLMEEGYSAIRTFDRASWDDESSHVAGESVDYPDGEALYYLVDADHAGETGLDNRQGEYWLVSIQDITSSDPTVLYPEEDEEGWHIRALKEGSADITVTFTGGPDGNTPMTHIMPMYVTGMSYELEVLVDGSPDTSFDYLPGTEVPFAVRLVRKTPAAAGGSGVIRETVDESAYELDLYYDGRYLAIDTDAAGNRTLRTLRDGEQTLTIRAGIDGQNLQKRIQFHISVARGEADVDDSLVVNLLPGETCSLADLKASLPQTMTVKSLRHPEGETAAIAEYWFAWAPEGITLEGYQDDKNNQTLTVNENVLDLADSNGIYMAQVEIGMEDSRGVRAYDRIRICIRKAHELPAPLDTYDVLTLPAGTTVVEEEAFAGTAAQVAVIPSGCTEIRSRAFADCPNLEYVLVDSLDSIWIMEDAFAGSDVTVLEK